MFLKRKTISELDRVSRSWSRIGRNLYRIHGDKAGKVLQEQARSVERSCQADTWACEAALSQIEEELEKTQQKLDQELHAEGVTLEKAKSKVKGSVFRLVVSSLMVLVGICIIAWSLRPTFYGMDLPWVVISAGSGLAIFIVMEILLTFVERILNSRQFSIFNALVAAVMVAFFIVGFVQMSQARALQMEVHQVMESDSLVYEQDTLDIDKAKKKLNDMTKRAMVFLFIGFEWLTGVFFYLAARALGRFGPIVKLARRRDSMVAKRDTLIQRKSFLEKIDTQSIEASLRNGMEEERTRGSLSVLVTLLLIIIGVVVGAVVLAEDAFGGVFSSPEKRCTYYLVGFDVTGSTEHDQQENQRAVIRIINSLQPGDEFQLMNITQETFSNPEHMLYHKMPSRAGYFKEDIRRHKHRLIHEFRRKCEGICKQRPATSLVEGLYMFSHFLQERPKMDKKLILISDMLQFKKEFTPEKIASQGERILRELKADGLVPNMTGIEVYVMGASTAGLDARTWMGMKRFWIGYFKKARATLKCYSIQQHWPAE